MCWLILAVLFVNLVVYIGGICAYKCWWFKCPPVLSMEWGGMAGAVGGGEVPGGDADKAWVEVVAGVEVVEFEEGG